MMCRRRPLILTVSLPVRDVLVDGPAPVQLRAQLVEVGHLQLGAVPHPPLLRRQLAEQQPQQRGLARAVGPDEPHAVAAHDLGRQVPRSSAARHRRSAPLRLDDQSPGAVGLLDLHPAVPARSRRARRSSRSACSARTRPSLRVRRALIPLRIQVSSCASFLSNSARCLASASSSPFAARRTCRSRSPSRQPPAVEFDDPGGQLAEEDAVVRDEQQRPAVAEQELLEPADGVDVEVVRRLVEQQDVGLADQRLGQQRAALHAAGEDRHAAAASSPSARDAPRPPVPAPPVLVPRRVRHAPCAAATSSKTVPVRSCGTSCDNSATQPLLPHDLAAVGLGPRRASAQQRGLARAVAAQKAEPVPRLELQADPVEQRRHAERDADALEADQCHRCPSDALRRRPARINVPLRSLLPSDPGIDSREGRQGLSSPSARPG